MNQIVIRITFFLSIFLVGVIILFSMISSLPESTIRISNIQKAKTASYIPEGWAFFTKNPQEEDILAYKYQESQKPTYQLITIPTGSVSNAFGLNRKVRMLAQEMGVMQKYIPDSCWFTINGSLQNNDSIIINSLIKILIPKVSNYPYLSGTYIFQKIAPIPWSWYKTFNRNTQKSEIVIVDVQK